MYKAFNWMRTGNVRALLGVAIVLDVINESMARYSSGRGAAAMWMCVDLMLFIAVARGSRVAWRALSVLTAFGAVLFLLSGLGEPSELPRGLLFAAQLLLLFSPAVRIRVGIRREQLEARAG